MSRGVSSLSSTSDGLVVNSSGSTYSISFGEVFENRLNEIEAAIGNEGYITLLRVTIESLIDKVNRLEERVAELENPNR